MWRQQSKRFLIQSLVLVFLLVTIGFFIWNTRVNLDRLGLSFGFDFLGYKSGFFMGESWIAMSPDDSNQRVFIASLINTIVMSFFCILLTTLLGGTLAFLSYQPNPLVVASVQAFVEIFRNIPLLLQIIFWYNISINVLPPIRASYQLWGAILNNRGLFLPYYPMPLGVYALPILSVFIVWIYHRLQQRRLGLAAAWKALFLGLVMMLAYALIFETLQWPTMGRFRISNSFQVYPEFIGLAMGLIFYTSAYVAESVRGCLQSVSQGQFEAARALGFSEMYLYRKIILPQALTAIIPQVSSHYLNITKNTSLGIAIGYPDVFGMFAGTVLNQTGRAIEIMGMVMLTYLVLSLVITWLMQRLNQSFEAWTGVSQQ